MTVDSRQAQATSLDLTFPGAQALNQPALSSNSSSVLSQHPGVNRLLSAVVPTVVLDAFGSQSINLPQSSNSSDIETGEAADRPRLQYYCQICLLHEDISRGFVIDPCGHIFCKEVRLSRILCDHFAAGVLIGCCACFSSVFVHTSPTK